MRQHRARLNAFKYTSVKAPGGRTKRVPIIKVSANHKSPPEEFQGEGRRKKKRGFVPGMKTIFKKEAGPNENRGKGVGGWGYQYRAKLFHYDYQVNGSQNAAYNLAENLERDAVNRAESVSILAGPLSGRGHRRSLDKKRVGEIRPFIRTSPATMRYKVNPAMTLVLCSKAIKTAYESTRIVVNVDGTDFCKRHFLAVLLNFFKIIVVETDPFGNQVLKTELLQHPLILREVANKIVQNVEDFDPETPRAVAEAFLISGVMKILTDPVLVAKLSFTTDAAADNLGIVKDNPHAKDAMCGENSVIEQCFVKREAPMEAWNMLGRRNCREQLMQFFDGHDLEGLAKSLCNERCKRRADKEASEKAAAQATPEATDLPSGSDQGAGETFVEPSGPPSPLASSSHAEGASEAESAPRVNLPCSAPPPGPREPPCKIDTSGPLLRRKNVHDKMRSYAEPLLREFWPMHLRKHRGYQR
jgi:hypothetical protein